MLGDASTLGWLIRAAVTWICNGERPCPLRRLTFPLIKNHPRSPPPLCPFFFSTSVLPSLSTPLPSHCPPPSWMVNSSWPVPQRGQVRCQSGWHKVFHSSIHQTAQWWVSTLVVTVTFDGCVGGGGGWWWVWQGMLRRAACLLAAREFLNAFICSCLKMSRCWRENLTEMNVTLFIYLIIYV